MSKTLHYLFDPLCGWCYGAISTLSLLQKASSAAVELLPTGLFSGEGARSMNADFSAFAWGNDQRIARLTGQIFTERYRESVLGNHYQLFDSGPATVALTAVSITAPEQELDALKAIQHARFVAGQDITDLQTLATIFASIGLTEAAAMLARPDGALLKANRARTDRAQAIMVEFAARGVPTFIVDSGTKRLMLNSSATYSNPEALIDQLQAA